MLNSPVYDRRVRGRRRHAASNPAAAYVTQRRPPRAGRPRGLSDLHDHVCIGVNVAHHRAEWELARTGEPGALPVTCQLTTDDLRIALGLVLSGVGIALLPLMAAKTTASGGCVRVLPKYAIRDVTLRLVTPRRDLEPMSVRLFREGVLGERWLRAGS